MKKVATPRRDTRSARKTGYPQLVSAISAINTQMVGRVATVANQALVLRNWIVGAYIVEFEQDGADRAKYGARLLETLAEDLNQRGVKGLGARTLWNCKAFYSLYPQIRQSAVTALAGADRPAELPQPVVSEARMEPGADDSANTVCRVEHSATDSAAGNARTSAPGISRKVSQTPEPARPTPLAEVQLARISWAHFLELIRIDDPWKRAFYENELLKGHWSKRQLQRQIGSLLYERTGLSTNKKAVVERARKQEPQVTILIDLKVRAFQPADAGQMNFYVNWFKANMQAEGDNPPVGILLCSDKDSAEVEFATAGMDQKLFVARYLAQLPSLAQLKAFLERERAQITRLTRRSTA